MAACPLGYSLIGISCAAIITMTLQTESRTQHLFEAQFLLFFGKYSYGIYVSTTRSTVS